MSPPGPDLTARLIVPHVRAWRAWLDQHEDASDGVRLVLAKKGVTEPTSLTYAEALEEALCSGWIDGRRNRIDGETFQQHFTPRRRASIWSQRNVSLAEALIAGGRMRPRGLAEVVRAKTDGRWERAYAGQADAALPDDLASALAASGLAAARFDTLNRARRYTIIHGIITAPSAISRANRISRAVGELEADGTT